MSNRTTNGFVNDPKFENHPYIAPICIYLSVSRYENPQIGVYLYMIIYL